MSNKPMSLVAMFALAAITSWGGSKERDWQSAKLLDRDRTKYFANERLDTTNDRPDLSSAIENGSTTAVANVGSQSPAVHDYYIVETQGMVYLAERIRLKSSPAAKLAATRPIKYAVEKNKLYLMNESGDEYQVKILKQVEREREK